MALLNVYLKGLGGQKLCAKVLYDSQTIRVVNEKETFRFWARDDWKLSNGDFFVQYGPPSDRVLFEKLKRMYQRGQLIVVDASTDTRRINLRLNPVWERDLMWGTS